MMKNDEQLIECPECHYGFPIPPWVVRKFGKEVKSLEKRVDQKDVTIRRLAKTGGQIQKAAHQGSIEIQGESFQSRVERTLNSTFRSDTIKSVPRGRLGADIHQHVHTDSGKFLGTIVWEVKSASRWDEKWVDTLKKNIKRIEGEVIGIIVAEALPGSIKQLGNHKDVWVTDEDCAVGLATALRFAFQQLSHTKGTVLTKTMNQQICDYFTGKKFANRIRETRKVVGKMKDALEAEKRAMDRIWGARTDQIEEIRHNILGIGNDLVVLGINNSSMKFLEAGTGDE